MVFPVPENPQRTHKSEGPLVLTCLGGPRSDNKFLENHLYVTTMIAETIRKIYPYINFSDALSIIDQFRLLRQVLPDREIYDAINYINAEFFPNLAKYKKGFSENQRLKFEGLNPYHKHNLADRMASIPREIRTEFRMGIMHPIGPDEIRSRVPAFPKKGSEEKNAKIRASEISNIIKTFPSYYLQEFY